MTYVWRHNGFGQYKSKGQCVAFVNKVQDIARVLPRHPSEVVINIETFYGWSGTVSVEKIAQSFRKLKYEYRHPTYRDIEFSAENLEAINLSNLVQSQDGINKNHEQEISPQSNRHNEYSQILRDRGMYQAVEDEVASKILEVPLAAEEESNQETLGRVVTELFQSIRQRKFPLHLSQNKTSDWKLMFPTLLVDGNGGPDKVETFSLREWISYVIQIDCLSFHCNLPFLFYSNFIMRKHQITRVSACKPMGKSVENAVSELVKIAKDQISCPVPESTLRSLATQLPFHTNTLQGSIADMAEFRRNILSMMSEHGPPTFFLTVSAADGI